MAAGLGVGVDNCGFGAAEGITAAATGVTATTDRGGRLVFAVDSDGEEDDVGDAFAFARFLKYGFGAFTSAVLEATGAVGLAVVGGFVGTGALVVAGVLELTVDAASLGAGEDGSGVGSGVAGFTSLVSAAGGRSS